MKEKEKVKHVSKDPLPGSLVQKDGKIPCRFEFGNHDVKLYIFLTRGFQPRAFRRRMRRLHLRTMNTEPSIQTATILDMGDDRMLGQQDDGRKVWLDGPVVPGDVVRFRQEGKGGVVLSVLEPAADRIPAPCPLFDRCPGCRLQPLPAKRQLELKADRIVQTLERLGGLKEIPFHGVRATKAEYGTRNKLDFTVDGPRLGYRSGDGLADVSDCLLGDRLLRDWIPRVREWLGAHPDHNLHRCMLRTDGERNGVWMLLRGELAHDERNSWQKLFQDSDDLKGIGIQADWKQPWETLAGALDLRFALHGKEHSVQADGFFQVHDRLAGDLVGAVMDRLEQGRVGNLLDLFCGTGAFTLPAANIADRVLGLDSRPGQGPFQKADLRRGLPPKVLNQSWRTVLTDPPRAGMDKRLVGQLRDQVRADRILYISCNPATLARDLQRLMAKGDYQVTYVEGFDLFPQTPHVETVVELKNVRARL